VERSPCEPRVARELRREAERRRRAGEAAGEEVGRDLPRPRRLLEHRPAVVRAGLRHRAPTNAAATPATIAPVAIAIVRHIRGRSRVVTTGSGGRPYTSGSSRRRKNAPKPPTPSPGSRP